MDILKGFFRLTMVLSILVVVVSISLFLDEHRYRIYEIKRELKGKSPATFKFEWHEKTDPGISDYEVLFLGEQVNKDISPADLLKTFRVKYPEYADLSDSVLLNKLSEKYSTWQNLTRRWEKEQEKMKKARDKGTPVPDTTWKGEQSKLITAHEFFRVRDARKALVAEAQKRGLLPTYAVLKIQNCIEWKGLILKAGVAFFAVWFIYFFIRWIVIGYIVKGFRGGKI